MAANAMQKYKLDYCSFTKTFHIRINPLAATPPFSNPVDCCLGQELPYCHNCCWTYLYISQFIQLRADVNPGPHHRNHRRRLPYKRNAENMKKQKEKGGLF